LEFRKPPPNEKRFAAARLTPAGKTGGGAITNQFWLVLTRFRQSRGKSGGGPPHSKTLPRGAAARINAQRPGVLQPWSFGRVNRACLCQYELLKTERLGDGGGFVILQNHFVNSQTPIVVLHGASARLR
jgi:hypothetical protein